MGVYNCFFCLLGQDLVECFNEAFREGEMSISQKRGVVTLLPKEESDLVDLSILEETKIQNIPGILLQLDFRKAFDTIEWEFIQ